MKLNLRCHRLAQQIDLINLNISEQTNSNIQSQYQNLIKSADELLLDSSYDQAIQKYDEANEISPNESYPIQKIREIKRLIIEINFSLLADYYHQ